MSHLREIVATDWGMQRDPNNMTEREVTELEHWLYFLYNFQTLVKTPTGWTHSELKTPKNLLMYLYW